MSREREILQLDGQDIPLTRSEDIILATLLRQRGRVVSQERLLEELGTHAGKQILKVYISKIRSKLNAITPDAGGLIHIIHSIGYMIGHGGDRISGITALRSFTDREIFDEAERRQMARNPAPQGAA